MALPASRKLEEAQLAYEQARAHRKLLVIHRREQKRAMQRFDLFKADLERMGIEVVIEPTTHPVRVDHIPSSHTSPRRNSDDRSSA